MSLDLDLVAVMDADFKLEAAILGQFGRAGAADGAIPSLPPNSTKMMLTPVSPPRVACADGRPSASR